MTQPAGLVQGSPSCLVCLVDLATVGQQMTDDTEAVLASGRHGLDPVGGGVDCEVERAVSVTRDLVDVRHRSQRRDQLQVAGQTRVVEDGVVVGQDWFVDVHVVVVDQREDQRCVGGMFARLFGFATNLELKLGEKPLGIFVNLGVIELDWCW